VVHIYNYNATEQIALINKKNDLNIKYAHQTVKLIQLFTDLIVKNFNLWI